MQSNSRMDLHDQSSVEARTSRMKFVWPMAQLTTTSEPRLTLTGTEGRTLSPKDLLDRLSREFRKSYPLPRVPTNSPEPETSRVAFPNTELAMRTRPSLLGRADQLLATVFAQSLAAVAKRQKAENTRQKAEKKIVRERRDADIRRRLFPRTFSVRVTNHALYSVATKFVDRLVQECDRRWLSVEGHGVRRLASYKSPEEFTIDDGVELVLSWLSRWPVNRHWFVKVVYNGRNLSDNQHTYYYTARMSVPTLAYPVAQVTCDVTFSIDVTRMTPPPVHVDVWYRVETDRSRHSALADPFNQEWIDNVVRWKLGSFKMFKF